MANWALLFLVLSISFWCSSSQTVIINNSSSSSWTISGSFILSENHSHTWTNSNSTQQKQESSDGSLYRLILERADAGFSCGFFCTPPCHSYYFVVIIIGNSGDLNQQGQFPGLVWTANREKPVGEEATLQLNKDGLILRDSNGITVWSTDTSGEPVFGMNITETGNLLLFNNKEIPVWQSFDHPTDTLVLGQKLEEGQRLVSTINATNWTPGLFYVSVHSDGFSAFVEADPPQMYFQLRQDGGSRNSSGSNYAIFLSGTLYVVDSVPYSGMSNILPPADSHVQYMRLGSDGHLKIYEWRKSNNWQEVSDLVSKRLDGCQYPLHCGNYGVCREEQCSCPKTISGAQYFREENGLLPNLGCVHVTPLSCQSTNYHQLMNYGNLSYFNLIDSNAVAPGLKSLEECRKACLKDCSCKAAFFSYNNNVSDGRCYLPTKIFTLRADHISGDLNKSLAFIKVQIPALAPSPDTATSPGTTYIEVPPPPKSRKRTKVAIIVGSSVAAGATFLIVAFCVVLLLKKKDPEEEHEYQFEQLQGFPKRFTYEDVCIATENFREKIGGGGFGSVFKGMLEDGTRIAVKKLDSIDQGMREFLAEVKTIGSIHHINLVKLIGFCAEKSDRLLIYEYMSNGSLDKWIFPRNPNHTLDWQIRKKIILDVAKGLAYLHEECRQRIAHLDIKPQNILLDDNFNAKVSDFGLAKLIDRDQSQVLTNVRGTRGYLAPEWQRSRITVKADNYSFGIVVLEIVCGRKNLDFSQPESRVHLLTLLKEMTDENQLVEMIDRQSEDTQCHAEEALKMTKIAAWCLQDDHTRRPPMSTVVKVLEGDMELVGNISFRLSSFIPPPDAETRVSQVPQASVLSGPR